VYPIRHIVWTVSGCNSAPPNGPILDVP
jgi:hypothetical protein